MLQCLRAVAGEALISILSAAATGVGLANTSTQRVAPATDSYPTIVRGTQGSQGFTVQNLKDAGRNEINLFMALPIAATFRILDGKSL